ncbi:UbiH/UbiF/VisC/COQ6 family ubiquinone biosynthesis hydroxylase [Ignatzschineria rhizosphaerae]|uniref:UbiH/UbiF/VisC/COQ6 family ubiquinone biosynthesis hydroxylase n=1 Tax=Ignatzschineria rhizosphaerae TaxID=2923279 RepID=A0ABY3X357_9GAMM|nr:UbiH/UbiF/VisC/COQ6 family ubiquinone biosynthesis hydroxylase [Ignatzschineria rhizosphaerae]UNM96201.1 UbiH/UbiF/VisC/COQ6 family ubiquinone biosynthesis hydroxylase [Ignatzschineria rhizosphaerae]
MSNRFDVIINGAGLVGSSIAIGLAKAGFKVLVIEFHPLEKLYPQDDYGLRVSAFTPSSKKWLEYVDAWDGLQHTGRITPFLHMHVWDEGGMGELTFDAAGTGSDALGWIMDNEATQGVLIDRALKLDNITILDNTKLESFEKVAGDVEVTLSNGDQYVTALIIGADGGRSMVRDWANIPTTGWSYGQKTIVGQVRPEKSHDNTCWQRFLDNGPLALLPLNDGRCSLAWHTTYEEADELLALDPEAFSDRLSEGFQWKFGRIEIAGELGAYPLRLNHAQTYVRENFALAGDAAHSIHPLAGLGVNIGYLDSATLVEELINAKKAGISLGDLTMLKRYEKRRKVHNMLIMGSMDLFKRSSTSQSKVVKGARNLGLSAANKLPFVKRKLARMAMGYYGDIPSFVKP